MSRPLSPQPVSAAYYPDDKVIVVTHDKGLLWGNGDALAFTAANTEKHLGVQNVRYRLELALIDVLPEGAPEANDTLTYWGGDPAYVGEAGDPVSPYVMPYATVRGAAPRDVRKGSSR